MVLGNDFPSAKLLLEIAKKEYDKEDGRKSSLETRLNILVTFNSAILCFILSYHDFSKIIRLVFFKDCLPPAICFIAALELIIFSCLVSSLIFSLACFFYALSTKQYLRFNLDNLLSETKKAESVFSISVVQYYNYLLNHNREQTSVKLNWFVRGSFLLFLAVLLLILFYIIDTILKTFMG